MAERKTLLSRSYDAPKVQLSSKTIPQGAFGDYSGLVNLGSSLESLGDLSTAVAGNSRRKSEALLREQQRREDHDNALILENRVREVTNSIDQQIAEQQQSWEPNEIVDRTNEIITQNRATLENTLAETQKKNPSFGRVATKDQVDNYWLRMSGPLVERSIATQASRIQEMRENNTSLAVNGRINAAGTNLNAVLAEAKFAEGSINGADRGMYSHLYRSNFTARVISPAVTNALQAAVIQAGGWTPAIRDAANTAHASGWLSTEQRERLMTKAAEADNISREARNRAVEEARDAIANGRTNADPDVIEGIVVNSGRTEAVLQKEVRDQMILAAAEGNLAKRINEGSYAFPYAQENAGGGPTIHQAQKILAGNDTNQIRAVLNHALAGYPDSDRHLAGMTDKDVRDAAGRMLKRINDQLDLPVNQVAQNSPSIRSLDNGSPDSVPALITAYNGWYDANKIPAEKRILVHQPHIELLNQVFKEGDRDKFRELAVSLSAVYGKNAPTHFARALAQSKESEPYAGALWAIARANASDNPRIQRGIQEFGETLLEVSDFDSEAMEKTHPESRRDALRFLSRASHGEFDPKNTEPRTDTDQTVLNIITTMGNEGQYLPESMMKLMTNLVLKKAYGSGGQSSMDIAKEAQEAANGLTRAAMVVRTNGRFSENPSFVLMTPDSESRGWLDNALFGSEANQALSVDEDAKFMAQALDAVILNGLELASYDGAFPWLSHLDNFLGQSALKWVGYSINGFENRDAEMWGPYSMRDQASVPESLRIPWADVTYTDGRPLAADPYIGNESISVKAEREWNEKIRHSSAENRATLNQQIVGENGFFVQLPSGDLQLMLRPSRARFENVLSGTGGEPVPVVVKGQPVVISIKELKAFRDNRLTLRATTDTALLR